MTGSGAGLLKNILKGLKTKPVGPSIKEAAEKAAERGVGLGPDLTPPPPPSKSTELIPVPDEAGGTLVDDAVPTEGKPKVEGEPEPIQPATHEQAAEVVESVNKPKPDPQEQNINWERVDTAEQMEEMWETVGRQREAAGQTTGRLSREAMIEMAESAGAGDDPLGWLIKAVETGEVDINNLSGNMMVAREAAVEVGERLYKQAERIASNEANGIETLADDLYEFELNITKFATIQEGIEKVTRTAGQLLGSFNYVAKNTGRVRRTQIKGLIDSLGGEGTIKQKAENIKLIPDIDVPQPATTSVTCLIRSRRCSCCGSGKHWKHSATTTCSPV